MKDGENGVEPGKELMVLPPVRVTPPAPHPVWKCRDQYTRGKMLLLDMEDAARELSLHPFTVAAVAVELFFRGFRECLRSEQEQLVRAVIRTAVRDLI